MTCSTGAEMPLLHATNPGRSILRRLNCNLAFPMQLTCPPAEFTSATPAAMSHSCLGDKVQVASARPAETRANLYAMEPVGRIENCFLSNGAHSPRIYSWRLAKTRVPSKLVLGLASVMRPL